MLVSKAIPNLVNGVSQQPDSLRLPSQAELQQNLYPSVVEGLMDRPPAEHIAKIYTGTAGNSHLHIINRDAVERYAVLIRNGSITVHDLDGNVKTVTTPDGTAYLTTTTPKTSIKALTVADYTFILNTEIVAAMLGTTTAARPKEGLVFVKAGNYGSDYKVYIDDVQRAIKTTSTTSVTDIATNSIAADLEADLVGALGAGWTIARSGSVISIVKTSGDFKLRVEDSQGGASLLAFKDGVQSFSSLPTVAPDGFEIKVTGDGNSQSDDHYITFVPSTTGETFGSGTWQETVAQGVPYQINPATMPHLLVRNGDGTFTFKEADWDAISVGDTNTVPERSFIGHTINDVFFFKNRLGLLANDGVIMSGVGAYFNFFPSTVTTVVDDDPIDYTVSHTKVSVLKHAVPFDEKVVLLSDQTQFIMQGTPALTAKTIQVNATTEFTSIPTCKPVGIGKNVYFAVPRGTYNGVREYFINQTTATKDAVDITGHVPKYIPDETFRLMASTSEDILIALTSGAPEEMYLYKYFYSNDEKLQSAWCKFVMGGAGTVVIGGDFIQAVLYYAVQRIDGVYLEKMNFAPGLTDPDVNFLTHYDRRITEAECSVSYNAGTNETTWTVPYQIDGTMKVVTRTTNPGQVIPLTYQSGSTLKASGNYSTTTVYIGQTYTRRNVFSKFFYREETKQGQAIVAAGRLQIRTLTLMYSDTGTFTVTVTQDYRDPNSYVEYRDPQDAAFTGRVLGAGSNLLGAVALASGEFSCPVWAQNDKVTIEVSSDSFLPMHLLSAEWEGFYHSRSRRI